MNGRNLLSTTSPLKTLDAYSYCASKIPSLTNPFVVIQNNIGCSLAPIDCFIKSYKSRFLIAASSSMITQCASKLSSVPVSDANGLINPMFISQYKSPARFLVYLDNNFDCLRMLSTAVYPLFAWSFFVATLYISGAPSSSLISKSFSTVAHSVVFPFFLPSMIKHSLYCLLSLSSTKPNSAWSLAF